MSNTSTTKKKRQAWIDNTRAFAIIAVIWMHTANMGLKDLILPSGTVISFNMHLFVFISGYCAYRLIATICNIKDLWNYLRKLALCIGIPNLCFWSVDYGIQHVFEFCMYKVMVAIVVVIAIVAYSYILYQRKIGEIWEGVSIVVILLLCFSGIFNTFWFLPFIMKTSAIAAASSLISKRVQAKWWLTFVLLFSLLMIVCPGIFHATMEMFTFYLLGLFSYRIAFFSIKPTYLWIITIICITLYIILFNLHFGELNFYYHDAISMIKSGDVMGYIYRQSLAIFAIIAIASLFKLVDSEKYGVFSTIGAYTLAIYPIHATTINLVKHMEGIALVKDYLLAYPIAVCILTVFSMLLVTALRKSTATSFVFLGKIQM